MSRAIVLVPALLGALVFPIVAGLSVALLGWTVVYPWLLGPVLAGLVAGSAAGLAAWRLGGRGRRTLVLAGALGACLSYATVFAADYAFFVRNMRLKFLILHGAEIEDRSGDSRLDRVLRDETGRTGVTGFILIRLSQGVPILGRRLSGSLLAGVWGVELLAAALAGGWSADPRRRRAGPEGTDDEENCQALEGS